MPVPTMKLAAEGRRSLSAIVAASIAAVQIGVLFVVSLIVVSGDWNEGSPGTGIDGRVRWLLVIPAILAAVVVLRAGRGHRVALVVLIVAETLAMVVGLMGVNTTSIVRFLSAVPALGVVVLAVSAIRNRQGSLTIVVRSLVILVRSGIQRRDR